VATKLLTLALALALVYTEHMPTKESPLEEKLDIIIAYLHRLDKRDRRRMWGGCIRGLISFTYLFIFVWSGWYFIAHGAEMMRQMTQIAAQSAAEMTQSQGGDMLEQIKLLFPTPSAPAQ
jgi:hypothetical protein